jgi:quercetin dioxygenase-like cupin family protein
MSAQTVVRNPSDTQAFWMLGGLYEVLLSSDETGGESTIMQFTIPAGMGPPPHTHPGAETVYVVDGTLDYHIGGKTIKGGPGSLFHIPADTVENFEPTSDAVKVVVNYTPGGIEKFFAEAGEPAREHTIPPAPGGPPDLQRLVRIGERYGMHIQP